MRLIKMFGLTALAAVAAMAVIGASSASATSTALCKKLEATCAAGNLVTSIHMVNTAGTVGVLLGKNPEITVLCLNVLGKASVGALGAPQVVTSEELNFTNCGTVAAHNNCTITTLKQPVFNLLKSVQNLGTLESTSGETLVRCVEFGFIVIHCIYEGKGLAFNVEGQGHTAGNGKGMLTAKAIPLKKTSGGSLCPETSEIVEGLLEPLENIYITG